MKHSDSRGIFELRSATDADYGFLWDLVRTTMRGHVEATWGWDEGWQERRFHARFDASRGHIIVVNGRDAGGLAVTRETSVITLDYIYMLPTFQRQGLGTAVVQGLMVEARSAGVPLRLDVLRCNADAQRLYERLGLRVIGENDERFFMSTVER